METLSEERAATREQLMAAWQLYIARVEEQLASGWQEHIERVFEERFAELAARLDAEFRNEIAARITAALGPAVRNAREQARCEIADELNRAARRMRRFENEEDWAAAVLEATAGLCSRAALFSVNGQQLKPVRVRILEQHTPAAGLAVAEIPLAAAPAFASAVESRDTIAAMRTPAELSEAVESIFPEAASAKAYLFPIVAGDRVAAVLYAESDEPVVSGLELVAALASAALDSRASAARRPGGALVTIPGTALRAGPAGDWSLLSGRDRELHSRAQRFARVQVAELRLYKSQAVKAGRVRRNLYSELKEDIDTGRETFRREFIQASPSMVDYFHLELVRTLANDDVALLGGDYPGPLV